MARQKRKGHRTRRAKSTGKSGAAVTLGRLGGLVGGDARARVLSAERRRQIARKAAAVRHGYKAR
jgi:hypothetical protein